VDSRHTQCTLHGRTMPLSKKHCCGTRVQMRRMMPKKRRDWDVRVSKLRRDRDFGVSRPRRDRERDTGVTVSRRYRDVQKTPRYRLETETFETETATLCGTRYLRNRTVKTRSFSGVKFSIINQISPCNIVPSDVSSSSGNLQQQNATTCNVCGINC